MRYAGEREDGCCGSESCEPEGGGFGRAGGGVDDDEEGDEGVLDGEEEVFAVCAKGEAVSLRVGGSYRVGEGFEDVGGERESACGRGVQDWNFKRQNMVSMEHGGNAY